MPNFAYINNKFVNFKSAKIHIEDRGLQFADSVYEVIAVLDNNLIDLDFHLKRLKYSLRQLEIKFTIDKKEINKIVKDFSKNIKSEVVTLSTLEKNSVNKIKSKLIKYAS